tara:strand:- start:1521 stop:2255 length:735 start_codon:yes stop_codon:yes gene_type:complete
MEASSDTAKKIVQKNGSNFIEHVTTFNNDSKNEIINSVQYLVMILIPLLFLNNVIDSSVPNLDPKKSNLELLVEILGHSLLLVCSIILLNRIITFFPTYSGRDYDHVSLIEFVLFVVLAVPKIHTKSKELFKRLKHSWEGKEDAKKSNTDKEKKDNNANVVSVSQPISGGGNIFAPPMATKNPPATPQYQGQHQQMTQPPPQQSQQSQQQPTSNQIYNNSGFGGLQGAQEPMAANDGFGAFSSF